MFLREVGAIDKLRYQQLTGRSGPETRMELSGLLEQSLITRKGKGRGTYYIPTNALVEGWKPSSGNTEASMQISKASTENSGTRGQNTQVPTQNPSPPTQNTQAALANTQPRIRNTQVQRPNTQPHLTDGGRHKHLVNPALLDRISRLPSRVNDPSALQSVILELCATPKTPAELAAILGRKSENHLKRKYIRPMLAEGLLQLLYPDMPNHPRQAYVATAPTSK